MLPKRTESLRTARALIKVERCIVKKLFIAHLQMRYALREGEGGGGEVRDKMDGGEEGMRLGRGWGARARSDVGIKVTINCLVRR